MDTRPPFSRHDEAARRSIFRGFCSWQPRGYLGGPVHGTPSPKIFCRECNQPSALQYTEFTAYAALLSGAPPTVLQRSLVAHHPHLWKLREHHLYAADEPGTPEVRPVSPGNPLRGYLPNSCHYSESSDGVAVTESGREEPVFYTSLASLQKMEEPPAGRLVDVFITGEVTISL